MRILLSAILGVLALLVPAEALKAEAPPVISTASCAWPFEFTPIGLGNATYPDTLARYWFFPFDPAWQEVTIKGAYPKARYFSLVAYDGYVPTAVAGALADVEISPEQGSSNPFAGDAGKNGAYTVTITRDQKRTASNVVHINAEDGWVFYRIYLPNRDEGKFAGVPLPDITVTGRDGQAQTLPPCRSVNNMRDLLSVIETLLPPDLHLVGGRPAEGDRIWFAAPENPPMRLLPNPHVKYLAAQPQFTYQEGRIIVIRGRMPDYPDTFHGAAVSAPATGSDKVQLRYWSLCQGDLVLPVPSVQCATDAFTPVDERGFYTIVVSDDLVQPDWLPKVAAWLPWGDPMVVPKLMLNRNMLAAKDFGQAIQSTVAKDCTFPFDLPNIPDPDKIAKAGACAEKVMAEYYPQAVWCDVDTFTSGGWQACFRAAGLTVPP